MLKILMIALPTDHVRSLQQAAIEHRVEPGAQALEALKQNVYDFIVIGNEAAMLLNRTLLGPEKAKRTNVMASTHQGIQLVSVDEIYYFQADQKYVVAHHARGQLLIDDSLDKLERDLNNDFVRIHRKTLVSVSKIEKLIKNDVEQFYVKLRDSTVELPVSRRQLAKVRKLLLCM